jgi:uncharacterized repeat protein (TIGR03803 family)
MKAFWAPGRKPVLALLMPLLWVATLMASGFVTQAGVVLTTLHSFQNSNDGAGPLAPLIQGSDGNFYGTTYAGGSGAVFKMRPDGVLTNLYSFTGGSDGEGPVGALLQSGDGIFNSTTSVGGTNGGGTVFEISSNGALTTFYSFTVGTLPWGPHGALSQDSFGNFYGTTYSGGLGGDGTVFRLSTNAVLTSLYSFMGTNDGECPFAGLVQGSNGLWYGTTEFSGPNGYGTVFKITTNGALTTLYAFGSVTNANGDPLDGANPLAALVQGSDGNFYGTTAGTGAVRFPGFGPTFGTVFKITTNGTLTTLYSFTGGSDGAFPEAALVQGSDGSFYGTTTEGANSEPSYFGPVSFGTVFKISPAGDLTTLYAFGTLTNANGNPIDGADPHAALVQGSDGHFYGTTFSGGQFGGGTVFRLTVVPEFQALTLNNGTLSLTWSTEAGGTYQLQGNADLNSSNWTNLGSVATATGATLNTTEYVTNGPQRFYRLMQLP